MRELWRWQSLDADARVAFCLSNTAKQPELASMLEWWLCGVFHYPNSSQSSRWWCDGVIGLEIEEIDPLAFRILGAGYWGPTGHNMHSMWLAPLEIEMYFPNENAIGAMRTIIRFGELDRYNQIKKNANSGCASALIARRPQRNADWAFAIELT